MVSPKTKKGKVSVKEMQRDPMWDLYNNVNDKVEPHRQTLLYGIIGLIAAVVLGSIIYTFVSYQRGNGQKALAAALEIYNAQVIVPGSEEAKNNRSIKKTYPDDQQKYKEAATAFDNVANNYSSQATLAHYYAAMSRTHFDPAKAQTELEGLSKEDGDIGFWSKIGLAELYAAIGQNDKAITAYQALKDNSGSLPKTLIFYNLGRLYERTGKNKEAIDAYFQAASVDRTSPEGRKANERLNVLDPASVKKLPPEKKDDSET